MKDLVFTFSLFSSMLFFSVTAILGIDYDAPTSRLYMYYCIISFAITFTVFLFSYARQHKSKEHLVLFAVVVIYILTGVLSGFGTDKSVLCFGAFCLPSICAAIYYANVGHISDMVKWLDVVMWVLTIALLFLMTSLSQRISDGTGYYSQSLSYQAALCFLLDLFLLSYGANYKRFALFNTKCVRFVSFALLIAYPVVILYSGGRGGFVVVFVGLLVYAVTSGHRKVRSSIALGLLLLIIGFGLSSVFMNSMSNDFLGNLQRNGERVFSYITREGIDMSETSSRDVVYSKTIELIGQRAFGYGLFSYKNILQNVTGQPYPHNLFLEWLMQGGILLFLFYSFTLMFILKKYNRLRKAGKASLLLLPIIVYPLVQLQFSASYMEEPLLWFSFAFIYCSRFSTGSQEA